MSDAVRHRFFSGMRRGRSIVLPVIKRTLAEFWEDRIPSVAAGVTFFFLLALFPAIFSIVSLYGLIADRSSIARLVSAVAPYLPGGAINVVRTDLVRLAAEKPAKLDFAFFTGMAVAIWSASGGVTALIDAMNIAFNRKETRGFLKITIDAVAFTIVVTVAMVAAVYIAVILPVGLAHAPQGQQLKGVFTFIRWPIVFIAAMLLVHLIYKICPDRQDRGSSWISWGSTSAAVLWIIGTLLFGWYVQNFGTYDRTYGSLGSAVGFLTWIWLSVVILLAGAELDSEIARAHGDGGNRTGN
ncbi:MAG TPA: YihY/virulence factor BrkB family protein [Rhizomicrobium sp.]|jgi:membrane protein|nr:YihY/virulence factor BrkB family protein [Rhizomicrobium sp.]